LSRCWSLSWDERDENGLKGLLNLGFKNGLKKLGFDAFFGEFSKYVLDDELVSSTTEDMSRHGIYGPFRGRFLDLHWKLQICLDLLLVVRWDA
jgi:hypothetical protein